jgi:hypothetical protein
MPHGLERRAKRAADADIIVDDQDVHRFSLTFQASFSIVLLPRLVALKIAHLPPRLGHVMRFDLRFICLPHILSKA